MASVAVQGPGESFRLGFQGRVFRSQLCRERCTDAGESLRVHVAPQAELELRRGPENRERVEHGGYFRQERGVQALQLRELPLFGQAQAGPALAGEERMRIIRDLPYVSYRLLP